MRRFLILSLALAAGLACAQAYRWVDPATGRTVISDTPPPARAKSVTKAEPDGGGQATLPYALKRAADNFPVTLYTSANCTDPCKKARELLNGRGIPFKEKLLQTAEEGEELKKLVGALSVPSIMVGKKSVAGFQPEDYKQLLDLAGYPATAPIGSKPAAAPAP